MSSKDLSKAVDIFDCLVRRDLRTVSLIFFSPLDSRHFVQYHTEQVKPARTNMLEATTLTLLEEKWYDLMIGGFPNERKRRKGYTATK